MLMALGTARTTARYGSRVPSGRGRARITLVEALEARHTARRLARPLPELIQLPALNTYWACSNGPRRAYLRRRGIRHTIPEKADSQAARLRKGSRGGCPPAFDEKRYKKRNTVERTVNKPKHTRAVANRYHKRGYVCLGTVTAAALVIRLRT
ncbi:hypothetical protein [Kitasatospora sp. NPDC127116]|uniref:hypothetical protein n=1 Tax=Kitasatospora sp. NPDC127116 TaxID=3345367 RepID=UPI00363C07F5